MSRGGEPRSVDRPLRARLFGVARFSCRREAASLLETQRSMMDLMLRNRNRVYKRSTGYGPARRAPGAAQGDYCTY
eukprot:1350094-Prymnesium_polylepis.2